ncbi:TetR/AcrR family transcriptional regulator (plasmid) [Streptomyces sp. BI20]|uniref:TetR/AcrR family transcriptional regulator n=1 Tax=Streptomyces sp. BI20 TaxID=3403460 RepID=UPI003C745078
MPVSRDPARARRRPSQEEETWLEQALRELTPRMVEKRIAMVRSACAVFGRDGYSRASVDVLAAEAGISTRTLYNHFPGGKAELFRTVVTWTSHEVTKGQLARVESALHPADPPAPEDLEEALRATGRAFVAMMVDHPEHFALVRHLQAEAALVPDEVLDAWTTAGPSAVEGALADALEDLADAGLLDVHGDADTAAAHFLALVSLRTTQISHHGIRPLPVEETEHLIGLGVAAFLRAYGPRDPA